MAVPFHSLGEKLFIELHGRKYGIDLAAYNAYGTRNKNKYMLPVDDTEKDRLDVIHTLLKTARPAGHRLTHVPTDTFTRRAAQIDRPRVMDLGCGTGLWMLQMAEEFEDPIYYGFDINAMLPGLILSNVIPSIPFNVESPWNLGEGSYQMIHCQLMQGSIYNWSYLFQQVRRHLAPGGWFESVEIDWQPRCDDGTMSDDIHRSSLGYWWKRVSDAYENAQHSLVYNQSVTTHLEALGFKDVRRYTYPIPLCGWNLNSNVDHRVGSWWNVAMSYIQKEKDGCCGLEAMSLFPLLENDSPESALSIEDIKRLCANAMAEASDLKVHAYNVLNVVIARAPRGDGT